MKKPHTEIIEYINTLKGYQGYVQFSDRRIEDIFTEYTDISIEPNNGFVYEAHFFNGRDSIAIRQINEWWYVDETKDIPHSDTRQYLAINGLQVTMAQIWEEEIDPNCENFPVSKLKKIVFAGFNR